MHFLHERAHTLPQLAQHLAAIAAPHQIRTLKAQHLLYSLLKPCQMTQIQLTDLFHQIKIQALNFSKAFDHKSLPQLEDCLVLNAWQVRTILACMVLSVTPPTFKADFKGCHSFYQPTPTYLCKMIAIVEYFKQPCEVQRIIRIKKRVLKETVRLKDLFSNETPVCPISFSAKKIEEEEGLLTDFANKFIGGGALRRGMVQEEIIFATCPELYPSMNLCSPMHDNEAIIITGFKRVTITEGYSKSTTHSRLDTTARSLNMIAIDALHYYHWEDQYDFQAVERDLNKAVVGFGEEEFQHMPIVTGNWGCGAFNGLVLLKFLIQVVAVSINKRAMVYCYFDHPQVEALGQMLKVRKVGQICKCLYSITEKRPAKEQLAELIKDELHF